MPLSPGSAHNARLQNICAQAKFDGAAVVQAGSLGRLRISQAIKALLNNALTFAPRSTNNWLVAALGQIDQLDLNQIGTQAMADVTAIRQPA